MITKRDLGFIVLVIYFCTCVNVTGKHCYNIQATNKDVAELITAYLITCLANVLHTTKWQQRAVTIIDYSHIFLYYLLAHVANLHQK